MSYFIYMVGFSLFLMATFVNDFSVNEFPAFYLIWLSVVIFRLILDVSFRPYELFSQIVLFFLLLPPFFVEFFSSEGIYKHGYIFAVLYINVVFMIPYLMSNTRYLRTVVALIFSILTAVSLLSIVQGSIRASIYFGPNVLYRIYGLLFALFLLSYFVEEKYFLNKSFFWVIFIMFLITLVATGSRGAIVVFAIPLLYVLFRMNAFQIKTRHVLFALAPALVALFYYIIYNFDMFWRLFYFDMENESIVARLDYLNSTLEYASNISLSVDYTFGLSSSNRLWGNYPHNFIMESFVYGGMWLLILVMLPLFVFIYKSLVSKDSVYIVLLFVYLPVFIGSSVSGDFTYNFPIISVPFVAFVYVFINDRQPKISSATVLDGVRGSNFLL